MRLVENRIFWKQRRNRLWFWPQTWEKRNEAQTYKCREKFMQYKWKTYKLSHNMQAQWQHASSMTTCKLNDNMQTYGRVKPSDTVLLVLSCKSIFVVAFLCHFNLSLLLCAKANVLLPFHAQLIRNGTREKTDIFVFGSGVVCSVSKVLRWRVCNHRREPCKRLHMRGVDAESLPEWGEFQPSLPEGGHVTCTQHDRWAYISTSSFAHQKNIRSTWRSDDWYRLFMCKNEC
jgi:hypothetical protein